MAGNELSERIAEILFWDTTSRNCKDEIFQAFDMCHVRSKPKKPLCSFYQGCGCDIVTILKDDIHTHIFSDHDSSCRERISDKLKKLESEGCISKLCTDEHSWTFVQSGHTKRMIFTAELIDAIDFTSMYGVSLFLVFEFNPGDTACKQSFWDTIKKQMIPNGYVIGSYTFTDKYESPGRDAFVVYKTDDEFNVCGNLEYTQIDGPKKDELIEHAKKSGLFHSQQGLMSKIFRYEGNLYCFCVLSDDKIMVEKLNHKPIGSIKSFGLESLWWGKNICVFKKVNLT
jgi:hypothetical protein